MSNIMQPIALVLAGGIVDGFPPGAVPKQKALLPVGGQPIANYVIQALEQSIVEKIFIIQDKDANLQEALTTSSKCVFFTKDKHSSSFILGMEFGLEKIVEYYGHPHVNQKTIMFVPCDIPLATPGNFNTLIEKAACQNADITLTIIAENLIKTKFPQRRFRSFYLADYDSRYTLQMVGFMTGELIKAAPSRQPGRAKISFRGVDDERLMAFKETVDTIRDHKDHDYQLPRFTDKLALRWLMKKEYLSYVLRFAFDLLTSSVTMRKVIAYLEAACQVNISYIESEEVEISADIDRPEDFPGVLGIPWEIPKLPPSAQVPGGRFQGEA